MATRQDLLKWLKENRKFVDKLKVGDIVRAKRDLDPDGADVKKDYIGRVFEVSNAYGDECGPMVRWTLPDGRERGSCNVYDNDVELVKPKIRFLNEPGMPWHGVKVQTVEVNTVDSFERKRGLVRVKLLEPTGAPGFRVGDTMTVQRDLVVSRRPGYA